MKIKDLERCVNVAWSPQNQCPIYLATGTAAQQLDASFSTNASLELYTLNLSEPGMDMELKASTPSDNRFYKVVWGAHGSSPSGIIVGGCDGGMVQIYDSGKLLAGEEGLISRQDKHNGPVQALDFNPFQSNLLASGAADSEIYIWDLNNTSTPMTPGAKSQPFETVQCVSWNRQVQHILATTFSTRCVVWDLRKNEPIIKLSDSASHIRWKSVCWHPEVATQLCLASEEDQAPVIQLWDLRFATSPLKVLDQHQRGVLSLAWCVQDPELLISCGKDNRILCWNPNSSQARGEVLSQVAQTLQWNFDVAWCPRNPALIAASSFDGHVSVYSLMGGQQQQVQTSDKIADSFPGMDGYVQAPCPQQAPPVSVDLTKPPKWLKRPVGASFAFGGKLISFVNDKSAENIIRSVHISQVITEPELINKAKDLEEALQLGNYAEYCHRKADVSESQHERYVWHFLKAMFAESPKTELLQLLGFHADDIAHVILNKRTQGLNLSEQKTLDDNNTIFDSLSGDKSNLDEHILSGKLSVPYKIKTGNDIDGLIAQAILIGDIENAVELCIDHNRMADALIIAMTGGADLLARTQHRYLQQSDGYVSALISALVSEDWSSVVNQCTVDSWKEALAAALTYSSPEELPLLCERLGERLEAEAESSGDNELLQNAQMCYICAGSFGKLVASWSADLSASHTPQKIQDLVELVTFLQKAIEQQQGRSVEISGGLANLLSRYAILLASQGNLNSALSYLGNSATDARVNELRERLYCHLGHKPAYHQQPQVQQQYSAVRRVSAVPHYTNQFSTASAIPTFTPGAAAPAKPFTPASPPVLQPPRPNSASGMRAKYILDPSMQSNAPVYNNTSIRNVPYAATAAPPSPGGYSSLSNKVGSVPAIGSFPPSQPPTNHFQPANIPNNNMNMQNNNVNNNLEVAQPALNLLNQVNATTISQPGWNDPPVISRTPRPQLKTEMMAPPPPITHPLFGTSSDVQNNGYGEPPVPMPTSMAVPGSMPYGHMPPQQSVPQMQQQLPPMNNFMPPQAMGIMPPQSVGNMPPPVQQQQQMPPGPPAVKPKGPVPEEHMYLQTVFNELQAQCSCAANNPQTKRKLEDVTRKLETLYDMLREHKLSAQTLSALHQMVQSIQIGDYTGGLGLHTHLVSGSDFAQIASFMPGIKVLLQCALQLQVFLR